MKFLYLIKEHAPISAEFERRSPASLTAPSGKDSHPTRNRRVSCALIAGIRGVAASTTFGMMVAALTLASAAHAADPAIPPTAQHAVTDTYHGVQVSDPYRWLEDSADPKVHDWSVAQDTRTRQYLDALPQRDRIYRQLLAQTSATSSSYHGLYAAGGQVLALYDEPPKQQAMIAALTNAADPALARITASTTTTAVGTG